MTGENMKMARHLRSKNNICLCEREVEEIRRDLSATRRVEKMSYEEVSTGPYKFGEEVYAKGGYYKGSSPWGSVPGDYRWMFVPDGWEDVPDTVARECAKTKLKSIYASSKDYSERYAAGRTLRKMFLGWKLNRWTSALEKEYRDIEMLEKSVTSRRAAKKIANRKSDIVADVNRLSDLVRKDGYKCKRLEKFFERVAANSQTRYTADTANKEADDFNWRGTRKDMGEYRQYCNEFYGIRRRKYDKNRD